MTLITAAGLRLGTWGEPLESWHPRLPLFGFALPPGFIEAKQAKPRAVTPYCAGL